jgi:predicted transcriptional regulator
VARPTTEILTEREARIMGVLWDLGTASAEEVREALPGQPHDSSVRTLLRVLEEKGYVRHVLLGRKYVYQPAVPRPEAQRAAIRSLLARFFDGSVEDLIIRMIGDGLIDLATWEKLKRVHREYRKRSRRLPQRRTNGPGRPRG